MTFYNTIKESGKTLSKSKAKAKTQENVIIDIFKANPNKLYTADDIMAVSGLNCPLTSIRRGITNLLNEDSLIKTDKMKIGRYGKLTHCYKLKVEKIYQEKLFE